MRTLLAALALAVTIGTIGSVATSGAAEAHGYRFVYKPTSCFRVIKYTYWGPKWFHICR